MQGGKNGSNLNNSKSFAKIEVKKKGIVVLKFSMALVSIPY